ncbi:Protein CBR-PGP-10 [Caenorhabditis briggsae]|uniref:Protein CBR-PGP-10 n=1 Tax=Caenorhabditis briggsae TaxID=6238 RepID=A8XBZ7_CAEBR|nr:Protein CBR-PGP-10 [Caenorhabditis briggsae]CAP30236.2 Protein CBR-PGP-10 [Caenorhabditis briggsae]
MSNENEDKENTKANGDATKKEEAGEKQSTKSIIYPIEPSALYIDDIKNSKKAYDITMDDPPEKSKGSKPKVGFFEPYKRLYAFADNIDMQLMVMGLFSALLQSALPPFVWLIMGNFVSVSILREEGKLGLKNLTSEYPIDDQFASSATPAFISMLGLSIAMFIAAFCQRIAWEISSIRQVFRIKKAYIRKLLLMDISWLESRQSGHVAAMLQESADSIYNGISDHLPMVVFILSYLLVNIGVCVYIQWDVTLFMCLAIPLLIISRILYSKWFANTMEEETKLQNKITNLVNETFNCITTVISFAAQKQKINKFEKLSAEHSMLTEERLRSSVVFDSLTQILLTELIFTGALCYGIWRVADNSPGRLCALAINMLYMCVTSISIGFHINGATRAKDNAKEICEVLSKTHFSDFSNEQPKIEVELGSIDNNSDYVPQFLKFLGKGALHFRDIHFSYPSRKETEVLRGISFKVEAGEKIAIVGSSGSGKSTLTALLLRFYDPTKGSILLDGENIKMMSPDDLRGQCSLVSQEPVLFDGTISDNIRYGRLDATQQEINDAARKVGAWKFINSLPDGMRTRVGERFVIFSGYWLMRMEFSISVLFFFNFKNNQQLLSHLDRCTMTNVLTKSANSTNSCRRNHHSSNKCPSVHPQNWHVDPDQQRRAWARSSLGGTKKLGKSYSVNSMEKEKLKLPVMSKKKSERLDYKYSRVHSMDVKQHGESMEDDDLPGKETNFTVLRDLIYSYRKGLPLLAGAIPTTIVRAVFYLLICFQVASVLEISIAPDDERALQIFIVAAIYTALIIVKTIFEALGRLFIALYGHGFCKFMRNEMFRKILRHGAAYFDEEKNSPGRLVHKVINESSTLNEIMEQKLDMLIPGIVCSVFSIVCALWINWKMALLCSFQFPAYFIIRILQIREGTKRQRQMVDEEKKAANLASVVLANMSTIKAYNLQSHFYNVFCDALKPVSQCMQKQSVISAFVFACQYSFTYILIAITLHFGKVMMLANEISVFDYMRVVLLTQFGANFFSQLIASVSDFTKAQIAAENVMRVIREQPVEMDNLSEEGLRPKLEGNLCLQNVSFRYPTRPIVPVLANLNLKIRGGESIALVGPSGSGKSSIISLFQRMYNATDGVVIIDKYNIKSINPAYLRRCIVQVGQEPDLFSFTIRENIAFGMMESEATIDKVIEAAKIADIHNFITSLPQGYDTEVGEFGAQLSGGQKQRIAIARAVIRKPTVLLLDEATSALDSASEREVQIAFERVKRARKTACTCIQIAHRLSTIRNVDRIYVIVHGEIAEEGDHESLMNLKGIYYEMNQMA